MATGEAQAQMNPAVAGFETILTTCRARCYVPDLIQMNTCFRHAHLHIMSGMAAPHQGLMQPTANGQELTLLPSAIEYLDTILFHATRRARPLH
jgi:hypothetical protein